MVFSPIISGGKWKPVPRPDGIITEHRFGESYSDIIFMFSGLTKENIKKGCWLVAFDYTSTCILYVHEDGEFEMITGGDGQYSLMGSGTISNGKIEVLLKDQSGNFGHLAIGLE